MHSMKHLLRHLGITSGMMVLVALIAIYLMAPPSALSQSPRSGVAVKADKILIEKGARRLCLLRGEKTLKSYRIALGRKPEGVKTRQGDNKTPEGVYRIDFRNATSHYHRALHISYPNAEDRAAARKLGVSAGGDIMIHGIGNAWGWVGRFHRLFDWTRGCIAVTNSEIEEIWQLVDDGTEVEILP
jgi:murein L,D-transpeptidase YafK